MNRKLTFQFVLFVLIAFTLKSSSMNEEPSDADVEETSILVVNYLGPLLELNGYTIEDVPNHLKYLTSKYYLIFSRGVEPLNTLKKMVSDYEIIQNSQPKLSENFEEYVEHFVKINSSNNKKALEKFVDKMLKDVAFLLQVVSPRDAVKFILYQEAYPDIMRIISAMVSKHYDAYLKERAKGKEPPSPQSNYSDPPQTSHNSDFDLTSIVREFVTSHGKLKLIKRILDHVETYLPATDRSKISDSTLDYLDNLQDYLEAKSYIAWRFIKGSSFKVTTDNWIRIAENFLRDLLTIVPFEEISNFIDTVVLNANNRQAMIIIRYERSLRTIENLANRDATVGAENYKDIINIISDIVINSLRICRDIFHDIAIGVHSEISQDAFLEYINELLSPYNMSTDDLSDDLQSIVSRTFARMNSIEGQSLNDSEKKILEKDMLSFRKNLEKIRDAIGILIPVQSEGNHIELSTLLQSIVNKFGGFASEMESVSVNIINYLIENPGDKKILDAKISGFAEQLESLESMFKSSSKKPSEVLKERLSELVEVIDAFVDFTTF